MPQPVVHFEVIGKDPTRLRKYSANSSAGNSTCLARGAGSIGTGEPWFLDLVTSEDGTGIRDGVGGGAGYASHAVFYVGVPNVEAALQRAENSGEHGSWVQPHHRLALSSGISPTLKAL